MRARLASLLAALVIPAAAAPAADLGSGLVFSARASYGLPFGEIAGDAGPLGDVVGAKTPVWLELGYRFGERVEGDVYLEVAPVAVEAACPNASCSASDIRFGLALRLHGAPGARLNPWVAAGLGIEVVNASYVPDPALGRVERSWSGFEVPVEGGLDVRVSPRFTLGPFVHASFGRFTSASRRPAGGTTTSASIDDRETHGWMQAGLRATLWL